MAGKQTDAEKRAEYWREQYEEMVRQKRHREKEGKRVDCLTMVAAYTLYICLSVSAIASLCSYDPAKPWNGTQRLLWCIMLALNVGFGVLVAMSRFVIKVDRERIDQSFKSTKAIIALKQELETAEETNRLAAVKIVKLIDEIDKLKKKK